MVVQVVLVFPIWQGQTDDSALYCGCLGHFVWQGRTEFFAQNCDWKLLRFSCRQYLVYVLSSKDRFVDVSFWIFGTVCLLQGFGLVVG